jgi:hypothetical protein
MTTSKSKLCHGGTALYLEVIMKTAADKMLILLVNGKEVLRMSKGHLPFHTPAKSGERSWKIVQASDTNVVIDSYSPPRRKAPVLCTPWKGSWASTMMAT